MAKFECKACNETFERLDHCPYTGCVHGTHFKYTCEYCRGDLELVEDKKKDSDTDWDLIAELYDPALPGRYVRW